MRDFLIFFSFIPFTSDTENASIANPTPKRALFIKNKKFQFIVHFLLYKNQVQLSAIPGQYFHIKRVHV